MNSSCSFTLVAEDQYHDIISAPDAWIIVDDDGLKDEREATENDLKSTNSARRIKALVEQVTGELYFEKSIPKQSDAFKTVILHYPTSHNGHAFYSLSSCLFSNITMHESNLHLTLSRHFLPRS